MPLPFTNTLDLKLIELVKDNPILYNAVHAKYLDFDSREVVWQKIGDVLNRPAQACKARWVNIRDMMRRRIRDRRRRPQHRSYLYKYEDQLRFMFPFFKESRQDAGEDYSEFLPDSGNSIEPSEFVDTSEVEEKPVARTATRADDFDALQEFSSADPMDVFLMTIGSTLRTFSPYYLNQAKSKIFEVVQGYELQQIVDKESQPGSSDGRR